MLSLRRPLIKDAVTKATLMRKLQLWLQSPNNSLEKSAHRGIHYHPTRQGHTGHAGRIREDRAQKLTHLGTIFMENHQGILAHRSKNCFQQAGKSLVTGGF